MSLLLRRATLPDGTVADVRIVGSTISAVEAALPPRAGERIVDLAGHVLLPAPAEPHAHLDKAFLADRVPNPRGDLLGAIEAMVAYRPKMTVPDTIERAERAARLLASNGITAIRTHADVSLEHGLHSIEALNEVKRRVADVVDVQIVALVAAGTTGPTAAEHRALYRDALDGADVAGGCPHLEPDPVAATAWFVETAAERAMPLDLHTDETLNPSMLALRDLCRLVTAIGFEHGTTASHCVSLGVQPPAVQAEIAEACATAGVAVVTLPQTNLFLQGWDHPVATPRGLTALRALLQAGAVLAGGADNLQDPFNPVGRGDPLETAALLVMAGHLNVTEAYDAVSNGARRAMGLVPVSISAGSPAELVAIPATTVRHAVASAPAARIVVRGEAVRNASVLVEPTEPVGATGATATRGEGAAR